METAGEVWERRLQVLVQVEGVPMLLGYWWMEAGRRGGPQTMPIVSKKAREQGAGAGARCRCTQN